MKPTWKRSLKKALAAALSLAMLIPVGALAADASVGQQVGQERALSYLDSRVQTVSADGHSFDIYSTLYYGSGSYKTGAWIEADSTVPGDTMRLIAYLLDGDKRILRTSGWRTESSAYHFHWTETPQYSGSDSGTYISAGEYELHHRNGAVTSGDLTSVRYDDGRVQQAGTVVPAGSRALPVNAQGLTYGTVLDGSPDLVEAVGVDGTAGYLKRSDFAPRLYTAAARQSYEQWLDTVGTIPLYDLEGRQIGRFALSGPQNAATDPATQAKLDRLAQSAPQTVDADALQPIQAVYPFGPEEAAQVEKTLVDGKYPVNALGETYGTVGAEYIVGCKPDLLAAEGQAGVSGYVYTRELERAVDGTTLNVYDLEGDVVDQMICTSGISG